MTLPHNNEDYPLSGFVGKIHTWLVAQRDPDLSDDLVRQPPSITFMGLFKNILKDKNAVWFLTTGYILEALFTALYISIPLVIGKFISYVVEDGAVTADKLLNLVVLMMLMLGGCSVINFFTVRQADRSRGSGEALTRRQLTWWALGHSAGWFSSREAGQIAHRISEVSKQVYVVLGFIVWDIFPIIIALIFVTAIMFFTDLYAGLFLLGWVVFFLWSSIKMGMVSQKFMMRTVMRRAQSSGLVTDVLINNALVRLFQSKNAEDKKVNALSQQVYEAFMESSTWARMKNIVRDVSIMILVSGLLWILGTGVIEGRLSVAAFVGSMGTLFMLIAQIRGLHHIIRDTMEAIGSIREGLIQIGTVHEIVDPPVASSFKLQTNHIQLKNLTFNYQETKSVLTDINLDIPDGQKIGLIGPSGAGKTTLMSILLRLWDVDQGEILIDGKNIKDIPFDALRHQIALIPQDTSLFHRTMMENIRYGRVDASDEEVIEAAKRAYAHDFIMDLPDGYNTLVGERGVKLSGGQRQRIAIARVILNDAPILILDEATSALDSESEKMIQDSLKTLMEGKTVIAIAHRLSTISHLDRLIVMDQGRIVEDGSHADLLKKEAGLYAKLWGMQSGGFLQEE